MRNQLVAAFLLAVAASGCSDLLARVQGRDPNAEAQQEAQAQAKALIAKDHQAQEETQKMRDAETQAFLRENAAKRAAEAAEKRTREEAFLTQCAESRAERVAEAKEAARRLEAWAKENEPRARYFDAHCKAYDSRGVKVSREHVADGVIIRSQAVGSELDVKCDGAPGRPKGIDAAWMREIAEMFESADDTLVGGLSTTCAQLDIEALGVSLSVLRRDRPGRAAILALPDPATSTR